MTTTNDRQRWSWWFWGCVLYASSIRVSHQTLAVIKPNQLHVHVMSIMFIHYLCDVFYHVHSCSCHVWYDIIFMNFEHNDFRWISFFTGQQTYTVSSSDVFRQGNPNPREFGRLGFLPDLNQQQKSGFFFHPKWEGWSWKTYRDPFRENKGVKLLVWLVSGRVNEIMVFIWFFTFLNFWGLPKPCKPGKSSSQIYSDLDSLSTSVWAAPKTCFFRTLRILHPPMQGFEPVWQG